MAKSPFVRKAVLQVLEYAKGPLQFAEVSKNTCKILGRKKIDPSTLSSVLGFLRQNGTIEKDVVEGKIVWSLTSRFHVPTLRSSIQKLITKAVSTDIGKILDNGIKNKTAPYAVFLIPPAEDEYKVACHAGVSVSVSWESPSRGIASVLFNDYLSLPDGLRDGIGKLILWAYWTGVREDIEKFLSDVSPGDTMQKVINENKKFLENVIVEARERNDTDRIAGEQAILQLLRLTEELIAKDNLEDFLRFALSNRGKADDLMRTIIRYHGNYTGAGELLFRQLTEEFGDKTFQGLIAVGERERIQELLPRHILEALDVWNGFISNILGNSEGPRVLSEIRGNFEESKDKLREYQHLLPSLANLMKKRQVGALYLWGFPEVDTEAEREYRFSGFEDWISDLRSGNLDHRVWLFEQKTLDRLRKAYRTIRSGRKPLPVRIDKEPWTLLDIYAYHPRGKDREFWLELLETVEERNASEHAQHRKDAVPEGLYSEFKNKETEYVTQMLDEEEREAMRSQKN